MHQELKLNAKKVPKFKLLPWKEHFKCYVLQELDIKIKKATGTTLA
jgi:hypothetical protein